jgi:hypothetical protein
VHGTTIVPCAPLFLVAESYGRKYAATLGVSVARAARAGELNITPYQKKIFIHPIESLDTCMKH